MLERGLMGCSWTPTAEVAGMTCALRRVMLIRCCDALDDAVPPTSQTHLGPVRAAPILEPLAASPSRSRRLPKTDPVLHSFPF